MKKKTKSHPETLLLLRFLRQVRACPESARWVRKHREFSPEELYEACGRVDWLRFVVTYLLGYCSIRAFEGRYVRAEGGVVLLNVLQSRSITDRVHAKVSAQIRRSHPYAQLLAALKRQVR